MSRSHAVLGRCILVVVSLLVIVLPTALVSPPAASAQGTSGRWQQIGPSEPVSRVFAPASGALFAQTRDGLLRSVDAGASWEPIPLPEQAGQLVAVHPADPQTVYATSSEGLAKTTDGGVTWTTIYGPFTRPTFFALAQSPTDPNLLFATVKGASKSSYQLVRTQDAGATWDAVFDPGEYFCVWRTPLLVPHPTDPDRLAVNNDCSAGRSTSGQMELRTNRGADMASEYDTGTESGQMPRAWSWGGSSGHNLIALSDVGVVNVTDAGVVRNGAHSQVEIRRTDDDGATWTTVLSVDTKVTGEGNYASVEPIRLAAASLVQDPTNPSVAYLAVNQLVPGSKRITSRILLYTSIKQGAWHDLETQDVGQVNELAVGIDGLNLYAATSTGLWRLPQPASQR
jgi:hypothetical protein